MISIIETYLLCAKDLGVIHIHALCELVHQGHLASQSVLVWPGLYFSLLYIMAVFGLPWCI